MDIEKEALSRFRKVDGLQVIYTKQGEEDFVITFVRKDEATDISIYAKGDDKFEYSHIMDVPLAEEFEYVNKLVKICDKNNWELVNYVEKK